MDILTYVKEVSNKLYNSSPRTAIQKTASLLDEYWFKKNIFLIELPTGYGKTSLSIAISLFTLNKSGFKSIISYPTRTLIENQYEKFKNFFSDDLVGVRYMYTPDSPYLIKPVTLTTLDTLSMVMFGLSPEDLDNILKRYWKGTLDYSLGHYLFSWGSYSLSNIIIDEFHLLTDSIKSLTFLFALLKLVLRLDQRVIVLSATLSETLKKKLYEELYDQLDKILLVSFSKERDFEGNKSYQKTVYDEDFIRERLNKKYDIYIEELDSSNKLNTIYDWLIDNIDKETRAIILFNTVCDAVRFYQKVKEVNIPKILLHSRYTETDRLEKIKELAKITSQKNYVIVSTQVIEVGVDISSNLFISEVAPANSLIQRLGRFLRREGEEIGKIYLWMEKTNNSKDKYKVYDKSLVNNTIGILKHFGSKLNFHSPVGGQEKIGYKKLLNVYPLEIYSINRNLLNKMIISTLNIQTGPKTSVKLFLEIGESFIREAYQVPIVPQNIMHFPSETSHMETLNFIRENVLGIPLYMFSKLLDGGLISGYVYLTRGKELSVGPFDKVKNKILRGRYLWNSIIRLMNIYGIVGFITSLDYDSDLGLEVCINELL